MTTKTTHNNDDDDNTCEGQPHWAGDYFGDGKFGNGP